ncbi:MAG TPA: hypothetical protein EYP33_00580 [Pyrodictium sp.]|nr:hypothetical protein [Pyrodictium sp.]
MIKPSIKSINAIRKKYLIEKNGSLTSAQYKEAIALGKQNNPQDKTFSFEYKIIEINDETLILEVRGNHLSKNTVDGLSFRQKLAYKKAFKQGAKALYLLNVKTIKTFPVMESAFISFAFGNKRSRDHDNNSETVKRIQDTIVMLGIIKDDSRKYLLPKNEPEEILIKKNETPFVRVVLERNNTK